VLDDATRDFGKSEIALTRRFLQSAEGVLLGQVQRGHQQPLCALDELAVFEGLLRFADLGLERFELRVAAMRKRDRGLELARVDRFGQVRADAARDRALDKAGIVDAGDDDYGSSQTGVREVSGCSEAVEVGHLDVEQVQVGESLLGGRDRLFAVVDRADRLVAERAQPFGEPERDHRVILGDEDSHLTWRGKTTSARVPPRGIAASSKRPRSPWKANGGGQAKQRMASSAIRELVAHAARIQLASLTAASKFFVGWAQVSDRYAQAISNELLDGLHGQTGSSELVGRLATVSSRHLHEITTLPNHAVDHFNAELAKTPKSRKRTRAPTSA
jgi:hypothetical protein